MLYAAGVLFVCEGNSNKAFLFRAGFYFSRVGGARRRSTWQQRQETTKHRLPIFVNEINCLLYFPLFIYNDRDEEWTIYASSAQPETLYNFQP